jgi:hypothetical protein
VDKENVVHIDNGTVFCLKKDEILSFMTTWMKLVVVMLNDTERQIAHDLSHMWNLKKVSSEKLKME